VKGGRFGVCPLRLCLRMLFKFEFVCDTIKACSRVDHAYFIALRTFADRERRSKNLLAIEDSEEAQ